MRITFVRTLYKLAQKNPKIILITGDLGFSVFEEYMENLPRQFLNAGVAEQNMTGLAAGMAMEEMIPIIYSIVPFVTMRNFEQIRNDICYQGLNVKIVGVGSGYSYGIYGHTHYGVEDMGILRTIPTMIVIAPGDPIETELATKAALKIKGPVYIRLGKAGEPVVHKTPPLFEIGKGIVVKKGKDVSLIACGTMLPVALEVANLLERKFSVEVISMHTIKPIDAGLIKKLAKTRIGIFTLEEHAAIGGLGSAVAEVLSENNSNVLFKRFGTPDKFSKVSGQQAYMREKNGLGAGNIAQEIKKIMIR